MTKRSIYINPKQRKSLHRPERWRRQRLSYGWRTLLSGFFDNLSPFCGSDDDLDQHAERRVGKSRVLLGLFQLLAGLSMFLGDVDRSFVAWNRRLMVWAGFRLRSTSRGRHSVDGVANWSSYVWFSRCWFTFSVVHHRVSIRTSPPTSDKHPYLLPGLLTILIILQYF